MIRDILICIKYYVDEILAKGNTRENIRIRLGHEIERMIKRESVLYIDNSIDKCINKLYDIDVEIDVVNPTVVEVLEVHKVYVRSNGNEI